jgi:ribosomal protein S18 acetylase RimI-like enzyme
MAINSKFRNNQIASKLMDFCEELALEKEIKYLKADTYSINTKMNSFFKKRSYNFVGEVFFEGKEKPFYVYEKILK